MSTIELRPPKKCFLQGRMPGLVLLMCLVITGIWICGDYGISWDEPTQRHIGEVNLQYIRSGDDQLLENFADRDHGAAFEVSLKWIEEVISPRQEGSIYFVRHLCSYLFFMASAWCMYLLGWRLFRQQWLALLGMVMLVTSPRIFAHAFFNSKDVPFLAAVVMALYALTAALEGGKAYQYILAGAACGFSMGIRTMGALLAGLACIVILTDLIGKAQSPQRVLRNLFLFGISAAVLLYVSWPALWRHPVANFTASYRNLAHFSRWRGTVLFAGITYPGTALPVGYIPGWFCISTPVAWLAAGLVGLALVVFYVFRRRAFGGNARAKMLLLCAALFIIPIVSVIALHSVLYDDWRHLYFIYAPFVVLAVFGLEQLRRLRYGKPLVALLAGLQVLGVTAFMIRAHPYQQVYFNALVPHTDEYLRHHYDYEYWGTSYRQALQYLLAHDRRDTIPLVAADDPLKYNLMTLTPAERGRLKLLEAPEPGAYFCTTFRYHPGDYPYAKVWGIRVGGSTVMQIYRVGE